ncbi:hypothetical protein AB0K80_05125 [Streptomyces sp. NPDC052682]|uniref:hypothetical protein n=1 Tax=Streptomyces sp. NPDC052682 TaxID=3154954 RepID=UPI00342E021D
MGGREMVGDRRRRVWRWAVGVWAALVVVAGGLTLWLQDEAEPQRLRWELVEPDARPGPEDGLPEPMRYGDYATLCPGDGTPGDRGVVVACAYVTAR